jgi:uncharacterized heparinase superfamily protein
MVQAHQKATTSRPPTALGIHRSLRRAAPRLERRVVGDGDHRRRRHWAMR